MNINTFIKKPVLSSSISIIIVCLGLIALNSLPIEQYPNIAPPTIRVSATYTGASAETIQKSVIEPLEEQINGVENMTYMSSTADNKGNVSITVYFKQGTDPDMAQVNVQNKVSGASGLLPSEVTKIGVSTTKRQSNILLITSLYSSDNKYDERFLSNYAKINVIPTLQRINGIGQIFCVNSSYSMRIWLKPDIMAQYHLVPSDIDNALQEQNIEKATGSLGENAKNTFVYTMKYTGRLKTDKQFEDIVIKSLNNGEVLRLKDVADVSLGSEDYSVKCSTNGKNAIQMMVFQTSGSNATQIIKDVNKQLKTMSSSLPNGCKFETLRSSNDFLYASIEEVVKTLLEALLLVVLVVYFFLHDFKTTLIPTISIIVSLIGTFAFMSLLGFSINLLTLFALVLSIGVVVDDAIVVVEAVQSKFDSGINSPYQATESAMKDVTNAIFTCTLVFMAVFIPVSFTSGTSGVFYKQFGLTIASAVGISCLNALTLSPALCAILLRPNKEGHKRHSINSYVKQAYNVSFNAMMKKYKTMFSFFFSHKKKLLSFQQFLSIILLIFFFSTTKDRICTR
jgi:HAE1 family hydrophobic/amphiphilic exporter-1